MKIKSLMVLILVFMSFGPINAVTAEIDYSNSSHWLSLPEENNKTVDIFYLYPTTWHKTTENESNICAIDDIRMVTGAIFMLNSQASVFEPVGNIYAPYYRQYDASYILSLPPNESSEAIGGIPASEATDAFDYYIENYNDGRPFILAGHSQGSNVLLYLLSDYMAENPEVYDRMIAAYVIGYPVTEDYLEANSHLKFAETKNDTGVIISYNTESSSFNGTNPLLLPNAISINPISWTRGNETATANESLGSRLIVNGSFTDVFHFADAKINLTRGTVACSTADPDLFWINTSVFSKGIFHTYDYFFYYYDIRQNAFDRSFAYLESHNNNESNQTSSHPQNTVRNHYASDLSDGINSGTIKRVVSNSNIVYGSKIDEGFAEQLRDNIQNGNNYELSRDTIIVGGPNSNGFAEKYGVEFEVQITNEYPGKNRGIIQVKNIEVRDGNIIKTYQVIYIAGSDRFGTLAALEYFKTLGELPEGPLEVEWAENGPVLVE